MRRQLAVAVRQYLLEIQQQQRQTRKCVVYSMNILFCFCVSNAEQQQRQRLFVILVSIRYFTRILL